MLGTPGGRRNNIAEEKEVRRWTRETLKKQKVASSNRERHEKEDLRTWYARQDRRGRNDSVYMSMSLFVPEIMNLKILRNYQNLKFTVYDDKSDNFAHVGGIET